MQSIDILRTKSVYIYIYIYVYAVSLEKAIIARQENYSEPLPSIFSPPLTQEVLQNERKNGLSRSHEPLFSIQFIPWDVFLNDLLESLSMKVLLSMITQFSRMTGTSCKTVEWGNYFVT